MTFIFLISILSQGISEYIVEENQNKKEMINYMTGGIVEQSHIIYHNMTSLKDQFLYQLTLNLELELYSNSLCNPYKTRGNSPYFVRAS